MTNEKLKKGLELEEEFRRIQKHRDVIKRACSDSFHVRPISINILNNKQEDGFSEIPASISKEILKISLLALEKKLSDLKDEFDSL